jgi:hypothetical protein
LLEKANTGRPQSSALEWTIGMAIEYFAAANPKLGPNESRMIQVGIESRPKSGEATV